MGSTDSQEQRRDRRVSVEMPIRFFVIDGEGELAKHHRSKTTNISARGVAFISPLAIHIDALVGVEITLPGEGGLLECEAKVMRIIRELPDGSGIEYGVEFISDSETGPSKVLELVKSIDIVPLLKNMERQGATDLHITADSPPIYRINRRLMPAGNRVFDRDTVEALVMGTLSSDRRDTLLRKKEVYFPFSVPGVGRWRASVFYQRGAVEGIFHAIDTYVPTITELGLPEVIHTFAVGGGGLVIITGGSSSGKSTTMAAMIRAVNHESEKVILTIEDPIQYIHENDRSIIKQREVGTDTPSIGEALRFALRQDPDVIQIDEIPSYLEMDIALRAAESGHLVLTAFATSDAVTTIQRIVGLYPEDRKVSVLHMLSNALRGIVSQRLVQTVDGSELVMVPEILTINDTIRQAIWTGKLEQIPNLMMSTPGSIYLDAALRNLIIRGRLDFERASKMARDPEGLRRTVAV